MKCPNCQNVVNEGQQFCPNCGQFIVKEEDKQRFEYSRTAPFPGGSNPPSPFQATWVPIFLFFLVGWLVAFYAFSPFILNWVYGIAVIPAIHIPVMLGLLICALLAVFLPVKDAKGKARLIIGLVLITLGLFLIYATWVYILLLIGLVLLLVGLALSLSFVGYGKPAFWLYPIGAVAGAGLFVATKMLVFQNFGNRYFAMISLILTVLMGVVLMIFGRSGLATGKRFSFGQIAAVVGSCLAAFLIGILL